MRASFPEMLDRFQLAARLGALFYVGWGLFHVRVAWDIYGLGATESGLAQARLFQLAAYMLTIALFVVGVALLLNWKSSRVGYWLNLCVAGWADLIWVAVVVVPGYVGLVRGLVPPIVFVVAAILSTIGRMPTPRQWGSDMAPTGNNAGRGQGRRPCKHV